MTSNSPYPLVSILMLTYNRANFIGEAIASVIAQTYTNFELIIIDDGSSDDTAAVIESFKDSRIHYQKHETNAGLLKRRQESLAAATGTYVAVLDSDDVWSDPDKLKEQVTYLESHEQCVLVGTFVTLIDEVDRILGQNTYATTDESIRQQILLRNQFAHSSVVMRRQALTKTAGYRYQLAEDLDLFLALGTHGELANLPWTMTSYRIHSKSESGRQSEMYRSILTIIKPYCQNYPHYYLARLKYGLALLLKPSRRPMRGGQI